MTRHDVTVVIVGAGMSGLAAARALTMRGVDDVVARGEVGGRCAVRATAATDEELDIGGALTREEHRQVRGLADAYGLETYSNEVPAGVSPWLMDGTCHFTEAGSLPGGASVGIEVEEALAEFSDLCPRGAARSSVGSRPRGRVGLPNPGVVDPQPP
jgi:threonine dehydrogenase-like Zn-dependent dehydrogenase